jgi:hypothetical protein
MIDVYGCRCIPERELYTPYKGIYKSHNKISHLEYEGERDHLTILAAPRRAYCLDLFLLVKD